MTEAVIIQKPVHWFLYDNGLPHERVNVKVRVISKCDKILFQRASASTEWARYFEE